jgi:hypothetical protein
VRAVSRLGRSSGVRVGRHGKVRARQLGAITEQEAQFELAAMNAGKRMRQAKETVTQSERSRAASGGTHRALRAGNRTGMPPGVDAGGRSPPSAKGPGRRVNPPTDGSGDARADDQATRAGSRHGFRGGDGAHRRSSPKGRRALQEQELLRARRQRVSRAPWRACAFRAAPCAKVRTFASQAMGRSPPTIGSPFVGVCCRGVPPVRSREGGAVERRGAVFA